jgi:protease IV
MTEKSSTLPEQRSQRVGVVTLLLVIPLVLGSLLSALMVPVPRIGVIRLEGEIVDLVADSLIAQITYARTDPSIRAVVLNVNSPGGGVTASENLYFSLLSLKETKPLIVSVDTLAASGGYFAASAGQEILGKPSSSVGNIGVVSVMPVPSFVDEDLISTGPFKLFGSSRTGYTREMEVLKQGFLRSVRSQRGDRLKVGDEVLARGELYVGMSALQNGLLDRIGTISDAIQRAGQLAKIDHYGVIELNKISELKPAAPPPVAGQLQQSGSPASSRPARSSGLYYLYVDRAEVVQ